MTDRLRALARSAAAASRRGDIVNVAAWLAFAAAGVAVLRTMVALGDSSFWFDELWTVWIVRAADIGELVRRIGADVHPPLYYVLAWLWTGAFGLSETTLRLLSMIAASASVVLLAIGLQRHLGRPARLLMAAIALTSFFWLDFAAMARMYGLGMFITAALALAAIDLVERGATGSRPTHARLLGLFALGLLAAFTHFYLLLLVGMVFGWVMVRMASNRDRFAVAAGGATIAIATAAYLGWLSRHSQITQAWFSNAPSDLWYATLQGLSATLAAPAAVTLFVLGGLLAIWRPATLDGQKRILTIGLLGPVAVIVLGIAISLAVRPSYSFRNVAVSAPFVWIAAGALIELSLRSLPRSFVTSTVLVLAGAVAFAGFRTPPAAGSSRQEFRAAAVFVLAQPACADRPIAMLRSDITGYTSAGLRTYRDVTGYYLGRDWRALPLVDFSPTGAEARIMPEARDVMLARLAGADRCRVLAYGGHLMNFDPGASIDAIAGDIGVAPSRLRLIGFRHRDAVTNGRAYDAWVLVVRPLDTRAPPL